MMRKATAEEQKVFFAALGQSRAFTDDGDATIQELAQLSVIEYEKRRDLEAEKLGCRVSILDRLVKDARSKIDLENKPILFAECEQWPEPVNGAVLLNELSTTIRNHCVLSAHQANAIALWILFAHAIDRFFVAPILVLSSPTPRCGKSTVLGLLTRLVRKPLPASNISPAVVFRAIEKYTPTLLIDEADSFLKDNEELRGVLNSGHARDTAFILRTVGDDHEPKQFVTFGAKAIALIGKLPNTLLDRSIHIELQRKLSSEKVSRLRRADPAIFERIKRQCARWVADHSDKIKHARPVLPESLNDRAQDNWEPLLAIADVCGGEWPRLAREAALSLSGNDAGDEDIGAQLLADIKTIFAEKGCDRIFGKDLIAALVRLDERPWQTFNKGKPMSHAQLSRRLSSFQIVSKTVRIGAETDKGFHLRQFEDSFNRYLPPIRGVESVTPSQPAPVLDLQPFSKCHTEEAKNQSVTPKPAPVLGCDGVTLSKGGVGDEEGNEVRL